jgi:transposase-like protein
VSKETVSRIADRVLEEMAAWQNRQLDEVYAAIYIDANQPDYASTGATLDHEKDVFGLLAGTDGEGANFWMTAA